MLNKVGGTCIAKEINLVVKPESSACQTPAGHTEGPREQQQGAKKEEKHREDVGEQRPQSCLTFKSHFMFFLHLLFQFSNKKHPDSTVIIDKH